MLETYIQNSHVLARIRRNLIREHIERLVEYMQGRGYSPATVTGHVRTAEHFGKWLSTRRRKLQVVTKESIEIFLRRHLPQCACAQPSCKSFDTAHPSLMLLLHHTVDNRVVSTPGDRLLQGYIQHLKEVCGAADETITCRTRYAREFLASQTARGGPSPRTWTVNHVMQFAMGFFARCKRSSAQTAASSLRGFLRYLHSRNLCDERLIHAVPHIPQRRHEGLPRVMTEEQIRLFLDSFNRTNATGRRDYAMALYMVELGLRVSEVVAIQLNDIDWRDGTVRVKSSKGRRVRLLPLSDRIGKATVSYIKTGRPKSSHRHVFLRHTLPVGFPATRCTVRRAICRAYERSGFSVTWTGTHILRHTAATRLLQRGASLKEIADLLGHRSIDTSAIYAKVNLPALAKVALPWPEVQS